MFYELDTLDFLGNSPWKRSTNGLINGTFEGDLNIFAQITEILAPDSSFSNPEAGPEPTDAAFKSDSVLPAANETAFQSDSIISFLISQVIPDG
jgi:hypothetical protein